VEPWSSSGGPASGFGPKLRPIHQKPPAPLSTARQVSTSTSAGTLRIQTSGRSVILHLYRQSLARYSAPLSPCQIGAQYSSATQRIPQLSQSPNKATDSPPQIRARHLKKRPLLLLQPLHVALENKRQRKNPLRSSFTGVRIPAVVVTRPPRALVWCIPRCTVADWEREWARSCGGSDVSQRDAEFEGPVFGGGAG
jgi:hypothetical protein